MKKISLKADVLPHYAYTLLKALWEQLKNFHIFDRPLSLSFRDTLKVIPRV